MLAQRSFEELGSPLSTVTFCVLDLETTGGSPTACAITEIGALKVRCGERVGSFQTLIDPGHPVPAFIRLLTGISDEMLLEAPPVEAVLSTLVEFIGGSVVVAHNARFDLSFINAALERNGYERLRNRVLDTAALARKALTSEVRNVKLATLADHLRCAHRPTHRAFADVLATTDVLHHLIERVAGFGITTLEDLVAFSSTRVDGTFGKIDLAKDLPRATGVYRFLGNGGGTLYVGKASDLRTRVRSYFYGDPRRRMRDLVRETQSLLVDVHPTLVEAEVAETRAIVDENPPFNRAGKRSTAWYLKIPPRSRVPRVLVTRSPKDDAGLYLGPFSSLAAARRVLHALRGALPLHRCTDPASCGNCVLAVTGSCTGADPVAHRRSLRAAATAMLFDPGLVLHPLRNRMVRLARAERFEEAAETRACGELLERALVSHAEVRALRDAGDVVLVFQGRALLIRDAQLAAAVDAGTACDDELVARLAIAASSDRALPFLSRRAHMEARVLCSWLRVHGARIRLLHSGGTWVLPARMRAANCFAVTNEPG